MRLSDILTLISTFMTFLLVIYLIIKSIDTICFDWFEYVVAMGTLFANVGINILAAWGK